MSKKHHGGPAPVPTGNRPTDFPTGTGEETAARPEDGAPFQEQDPKRRLGDFATTGEHARQQPSRLNDGDTHRK